MNKKEARTLIKERRMNLSKEYIDIASDKIFEKLLQNEDFTTQIGRASCRERV